MRLRLVLACLATAAISASLVVALGLDDAPESGTVAVTTPACPYAIPVGRSIATAQATTRLFVTEVVLRRNPVCGFALSSARLRTRIPIAAWAREETPVRPFPTRFPPVAYRDASSDPAAPEAVYLISRRALEFVVVGSGGRREIPMTVGVAAPDAGTGAYRVVLVVDAGSWRVDRWWRVRFTSTDD